MLTIHNLNYVSYWYFVYIRLLFFIFYLLSLLAYVLGKNENRIHLLKFYHRLFRFNFILLHPLTVLRTQPHTYVYTREKIPSTEINLGRIRPPFYGVILWNQEKFLIRIPEMKFKRYKLNLLICCNH